MSKIRINIDNISILSSRIQKVRENISSVSSSVSSLQKKVDSNITSQNNISSRMQKITSDLSKIDTKVQNIKRTVEKAADSYNSTENRIKTMAAGIRNNAADVHRTAGSIIPLGQMFVTDQTKIKKKEEIIQDPLSAFLAGELTVSNSGAVLSSNPGDEDNYLNVLSGTTSLGVNPVYGTVKDKRLVGDEKHKNLNRRQQQKHSVDNLPDEKFYNDPKATVLEVRAEASAEGSVLDVKNSGNAKYGQGTIEAKVLTGEAHVTAGGGLYVYTADKNGDMKKVFSPGVNAEVGASVAVVDFEADGAIGLGENNDMLGAYGSVGAEVLEAEAKGKISLNRREIYAGASAEANLVKAEATGGISVLGTRIGVTGAVKAGAGAHAEVGMTDGKFKADVGVALGPGLDVGLEVDVSGTVDAVTGLGKSVWQGMYNWGYNLYSHLH